MNEDLYPFRLPSRTGNANKYLQVNAAGTALEWDNPGTLEMDTITDPALNAAVTTAKMDAFDGTIITLTTTGNNQTMAAPTVTTPGKHFTIVNNDASTDTIDIIDGTGTITLAVGSAQKYVWDGTVWIATTAVDASDIAFTPAGNNVATDVQSAIEALDVPESNIIYVGKHGNDSNSGDSIEFPKLTFTAAITAASALTPSASNRVAIVCNDAGEYTEDLTIPEWCGVIGQACKIIGNHIIADNALLESFRLVASTGNCVSKTAGAGDSTVMCERMILSGTAGGVLCSSGNINYKGSSVVVENGVAFASTTTARAHIQLQNIDITGTGYGVLLVANGTLYITCGSISNATGTALFCAGTGIIYAHINLIDCLNAYNVGAGSTLNLVCSSLSGTETNAGTVNYITGDKGMSIQGDIATTGAYIGTGLSNAGALALEATDSAMPITVGTGAGDDFTINTTGFIYEGDTGNVGIGTASPSSKLHVTGDALFQNATNSTTSFNVKDVAGSDTFTVDTTNRKTFITSTDSSPLNIAVENNNCFVNLVSSDYSSGFYFKSSGITKGIVYYNYQTDSLVLSHSEVGIAGLSQIVLKEGELGIGTTTPDGTLHVHTASAGTVTASTGADELVLENSANGGLSILTPNTEEGRIYFGDPDNTSIGRVVYDHATNAMSLWTGGSERLTVDSSGNGTITGGFETGGDTLVKTTSTTAFDVQDGSAVSVLRVDTGNQKVTMNLGSSISPTNNGDMVVEATNNTTLTFKLRGTDGTVRSGTIALT